MSKHTRPKLTNPRRRRYPNVATYLMQTGESMLDLAEAVGVTQPQISRIVRGLSIPRPALARRLADHCGVPVDSFIREYVAR
jgi:transcriptional regulator with XRE-family HTH domain